MRAPATLLGVGLILFALAAPAAAIEDGLMETSSFTPNEDFTHAEFEHVITNLSDAPIAVAPRDLRSDDYPILTLIEVTVGTFDGGVWTVGTLEGGQTASITYTGDAATDTTTTTSTTVAPTSTTTTSTTAAPTSTTVAPTTTTVAAPPTTAPEELPYTGPNGRLAALAIVGFALLGLGTALLRTVRA